MLFSRKALAFLLCVVSYQMLRKVLYQYVDFTLTGLLVWVDFINVQL